MRSSSMKTPLGAPLSSNSGTAPGIQPFSNSNKPPIPPKPSLQTCHRLLAETKQELVDISNDQHVTSNYYSAPRYLTYPTAVLIQDEHIPYSSNKDFDANSTLETITPLSSMSCKDKYNGSHTNLPQKALQGVLPALTKAEITPKYALTQVNPEVLELKNNARSGGRTLSGSAKNALLMEKIGRRVKFYDGSKEILPRANSNPETSSSNSVTVNRRSIISVNNYNNNSFLNNNNEPNTRNIRSKQRRSLNLDNPKPSICNEVILNTVPIATSVALTKQKDYRLEEVNSSLYNNICSSCNYYQNECRCNHRNQEAFPIYIVTKRNDSECSLQGLDAFSNGDLNHRDHLQPQKFILNGKQMPFQTDEMDSSCDKHRNRLKSSSPSVISSQSAPCSPATKPHLKKTEAIDLEDYDYYKRLSRGISRATDNVNIVSKARSEIAQGIWDAIESGNSLNNTPFFVETPVFTFTLPDLSVYTDEFRAFLEKDLIEMSTLVSLEAAGRLNWWAMIAASQRLWPLATTGDGNCLLHAASLGMWGFHDRLLTLRKALHEFLTRSQFSRPLWRRWRWQLALQNKETGLVLSPNEWDAEWESVLRLASSAPRGGAQPLESTTCSAPNLSQTSNSLSQGKLNTEFSGPVYESLEEIHVLALAHVLRRPIIVVADVTLKDMNGDPLAPIPFGGIYLPLECPPRECQRSPLLLTYDAAHFSALVVMETSEKESAPKPPLPAVIPVSDCFHALLPVQFAMDPGEDFVWGRDESEVQGLHRVAISSQDKKALLNDYLDLIQVPIPSTYLEASAPHCSVPLDDPPSDDHLPDSDKKSSESSFDSDDGPPFPDGGGAFPARGGGGGGGKAPRQQLQTVVRSFGSIGRSMSKRIKKNLTNLSKLSRSGSLRRKAPPTARGWRGGVRVGTQQSFILGARIHTDRRQDYQQEMIQNYLATARERFMRDPSSHAPRDIASVACLPPSPPEDLPAHPGSSSSLPCKGMQCINAGCALYGTAQTSYMCSACFHRQREHEEREYQQQQGEGGVEVAPLPPPPLVRDGQQQSAAGKSKFYAALDETSVRSATLIPVSAHTPGHARDQTLFLSNSTFYNDAPPSSSLPRSVSPASIPSYNLNRDLKRGKASSKAAAAAPCDASVNGSRSSSCSLVVAPTRSSPPDDVRSTLLRKGMTTGHLCSAGTLAAPPAVVDSSSSLNGARGGLGLSKPCLTKGCDFYGSSSSGFLCSKCHSGRKKAGLEAASLDATHVKYVQI